MKNYIYLILIFTSIILTTSCDDKISSLENLNTEPNLEYFSRSTVRWTNSNDVIRDSAKVYNKQNNANYSVSLRAKDINNNFQNITISESKNGGLFFINDDLFEDMKTVEIDSFSLAFRYYSTEVRSFKVISEDDFGKSKEATFEISFIDNILPNSVLEIRQINDISLNEYILDGTLSQDGDYNLGGFILRYEFTINGNVILTNNNFVKHIFSSGEHSISLRVMDNDEEWSEQNSMTLFVN